MRWLPMVTLTLCVTSSVQAGLLEDARQAVRYQLQDSSGYSVRGSVNLPTGQQSQQQTLLRVNAAVGGMGCGASNLGTALREAFEEVPEALMKAGEGIVAGLPLLLICYGDPGLCDDIKHWHGVLTGLVSARFARCQQIQSAMAYAGARLREGEQDSCLSDVLAQTGSLNKALERCATTSSLRLPNGLRGDQVNLVHDVLQEAGASPEVRTLAQNLFGEVTIRTGEGRIGVTSQRARHALLRDYEARRAAAIAAYYRAVEEKRTTGTVSPATLEAISVPGQIFPEAALDALATFEDDPERLEHETGALATAKAITDLTWTCHQLEMELREATANNANIKDEQRRLLEERYKVVRADLQQLMEKITVVSSHYQPAIDRLLQQYTATQEVARQAGLRAPARSSQQGPYRTQTPMGQTR